MSAQEESNPSEGKSVFTFTAAAIEAETGEEEDYSQYFDDHPTLPSQPQNSAQSDDADYDEVVGESTISPAESTILPILNDFIEFIKYAGFSFILYWNENDQPQSYNYQCTASPLPQDKLAEEERTTQKNFLNFIEESMELYHVKPKCIEVHFKCYATRDEIDVEYAPSYDQAADDNSVFSDAPDEENIPSTTGFTTEKLGDGSNIEDVS